jgi:hypothetical protein
MSQAQLIQGTGAELLPHVERLRDRKNLLLIIPAEESDDTAGLSHTLPDREIPPGTLFRNGVPMFPSRAVPQRITLELVKQLAEED